MLQKSAFIQRKLPELFFNHKDSPKRLFKEVKDSVKKMLAHCTHLWRRYPL